MAISRREFLSSLVGGVALASASSSSRASIIGLSKTDISDDVRKLIMGVWGQTQSMSPKQYLGKVGFSKQNAKQLSEQDFMEGRVLSVDGLMLSLTESALLIV